MATLGWMTGCWIISLLKADASTLSGFSGAAVWIVVAAFTLLLPNVDPPKSLTRATLRERLGLDALVLLKDPAHRVVFVTVVCMAIPIAAFYPYTPPQLRELGFERTTAWMSFGQISEMLAMFGLGVLLVRYRLKWIFLAGITFGVLRFAFCSLEGKGWLLAGISLHGLSFTLIFITAQIYLDERVNPAWRARGQALLSLMSSGAGNLLGYLGTGAWFILCTTSSGARWPIFWLGLSTMSAAVFVYFLLAYRGIGTGLAPARKSPA